MIRAAQRALVFACICGAHAVGTATAEPVALDRSPERVRALSIPANSRDPAAAIVPVHGPWRVVQTVDGVRTWETRLPVRPRTLFFRRAPPGMKLARTRDGPPPKRLSYDAKFSSASAVDTWAASSHALQVRRPIANGPPEPGEYRLRYPRAIEREAALNRDTSDAADDKSFVFRSVQIDDTNRHGLLLPAPSDITFDVAVPEGAFLRFDARIVPPEAAIPGESSDGATLHITAGTDAGEVQLYSGPVSPNRSKTVRLDLAQVAGTSVELRFHTDPGDSPLLDYVFLSEPTVYVPEDDPPRVVVIFIDTLRPDHMSLYGYERETSPEIDAWAEGAAVFTQARTIAPWTLPSTRTMLSGAQPERWDKSARLQNRFARAGWTTGFFAGNVYLSSNFGMAEGWGEHRCINWPQASVQVDRALDFLDRNADRPAFMMLHLMDMHLPYTEPFTYRRTFAGDTPAELGSDYFLRQPVSRAGRRMGPEGKQYVRDRYDNNLRYVDDQVARVLDRMGDQDTVVILSDHGEEFWDHGGFEHGHTLYEELLRVPMVLSGPGVVAGRFDEPVSLLDVAPSLAAISGLPTDGMFGMDLRTLADGSRTSDFAGRPHAFGRPLYGLRRWGSLRDGQKYLVEEGRERLFDLRVDPGETDNRIEGIDPAPWRQAMSVALERPVVEAWRILPSRRQPKKPVRMTLRWPEPVRAAWAGLDPTLHGKAKVTIENGEVTARWPKQRSRVEVFVVPPEHDGDAAPATVAIRVGKTTETLEVVETPPDGTGRARRYAKVTVGGRTVTITSTVVPIPSDADGDIVGFDPEVAGDLEAIGYVGD